MKRSFTRQEAWLALSLVPGVGRSSVARLIAYFEDPCDALTASELELSHVEGLNPKTARAIREFDFRQALEQEQELLERYEVQIITLDDDAYPENLRHISDPPAVLYVKGELKETDKYAVAMVGARKCSRYGKLVAEDLAKQLAEKGITVVSGMARGIDSAAHRGVIKAAGRTIAVLGNGLSVVYPPENKELMEQIAQNGAVISEFSMATTPIGYNFPIRNRIISGLSLGVVVVEAAKRSGSSITIGCALEQGRECFAVPGSINSFTSRGTHHHIKLGAKLVENVEDILEELQPQLIGLKADSSIDFAAEELDVEITSEEEEVLSLLSYDPVYVDEVTINTNLTPQQVLGVLMSLEMKNRVIQSPGQLYSLR